MNDINSNPMGYVVVTDYIKANTGKDVSDEIQKIIDANPMRTIYFPDGEYIISKPVCTSAKPENAVSLKLSDFAVIKAADNWSSDEAMIRLGAAEPYNTIYRNGSNYGISGGIIDGNMVANGISIDSGRETNVNHVSIKHTFIGLHIKKGANNGSSDADIEAVNIVGNNMPDSIGVLIEGHDNTFTNMRIAAVQTGVMLKSGGNFLRNIHPLFIYGYEFGGNDLIDFSKSVAFDDRHTDNWYDYCYSDQMATGFCIAPESKAIYMNCSIMWYAADKAKAVGFRCDGKFDASILNATVRFRDDVKENVFLLKEGKEGNGIIENPVFNDALENDGSYRNFLTGKVIVTNK